MAETIRFEVEGNKIFVPNRKSPRIVVAHPYYNHANSLDLQAQIRKDGLREPTSGDVTLFAHALYKGKGMQAREFTELMDGNFVRAFTGVLFEPRTQLAYFIDCPKFDGNSVVDTRALVRRMGESYAQVPFKHIREGPIAWRGVARHPYFIAWAHGEEGAERLAELAERHPAKEAYEGVPNVEVMIKLEGRVTSLGSGLGGRLGVATVEHGYGGDSYSFGKFDLEAA